MFAEIDNKIKQLESEINELEKHKQAKRQEIEESIKKDLENSEIGKQLKKLEAEKEPHLTPQQEKYYKEIFIPQMEKYLNYKPNVSERRIDFLKEQIAIFERISTKSKPHKPRYLNAQKQLERLKPELEASLKADENLVKKPNLENLDFEIIKRLDKDDLLDYFADTKAYQLFKEYDRNLNEKIRELKSQVFAEEKSIFDKTLNEIQTAYEIKKKEYYALEKEKENIIKAQFHKTDDDLLDNALELVVGGGIALKALII